MVPFARHRSKNDLTLLAAILLMLVCAPGLTPCAVPEPNAPAPEAPELRGAAPKVVTAGKTTETIHLDGRLDEPAWSRAGIIHNLVQQDPHPGEATPYSTEVRVLVDEGNLYVGITCLDPEPDRIAVHTMIRDGNLSGDDAVVLVFETLGDQRRGYTFHVSAAGARLDGLISGPESYSTDWDGIWDARVQRTAKGWVAEIGIPAQTLRFAPGADTWGFNVERYLPRDRLTLRWAGTTLNARLTDFRRAGRLAGMAQLRQGKGLSISPYGLVRSGKEEGSERSTEGDAGLDVTWNMTPELAAVLTVNTDFAETEVDTRRVNLTRFPLFFPEKRSFFLEGSNLFSFGSGLRSDFIPFFSRRIGLFEEERVPINAGVKLIGQAGRWGIALLDTQTGDTSTAPATNLFAGRVTYDFNEHLSMGTIITNGDPNGLDDNSLFGVDMRWQTSTFRGDKNFWVGGWAAVSRGDNPEGGRSGWGIKVDYPNDLWDLFFLYKEFGEGLDPALGFLPRPGTRWFQGGGSYQPRPEGGHFDWVRQFFFEFYVNLIEDLEGQTESWRVFTAPFNARTESGEHIEANAVPTFEYLGEPFEIASGVFIPAGGYHFTRYRIEAQSSRHRPWQAGAEIWFGDFYDGTLTQYETFLRWTSTRGHLQLELEAENNFAHLPGGNFVQRLWQINAVYAFTPDLVLSSFSQYDSETRNLGTNSRLRWTLHPGNDLFVVWNHDWQRPIDNLESLTLHTLRDQLVVKLRWTFRR